MKLPLVMSWVGGARGDGKLMRKVGGFQMRVDVGLMMVGELSQAGSVWDEATVKDAAHFPERGCDCSIPVRKAEWVLTNPH